MPTIGAEKSYIFTRSLVEIFLIEYDVKTNLQTCYELF